MIHLMLEFTNSSLSNKRVGFNKTVLDKFFLKKYKCPTLLSEAFPSFNTAKKIHKQVGPDKLPWTE